MRGRVLFLLLLCLSFARVNAASPMNPFANVTSAQLAAKDTLLARGPGVAGLGLRYALRDGGAQRIAGFVGNEPPVSGRLRGGPWVALVALDTGGTIGAAAWLAYVPHRPAHAAVLVAGTDASIDGATIAIRSKIYDPTAPNCCPRHVRLTTYAFRDGTFHRLASSVVPAGKRVQRTSRATAPAIAKGVARSWVGRCFPDFAYAFGRGDGPVPALPHPTTVGRIETGVWQRGWRTGRVPAFLDAAPNAPRVVDAYDRTRRTLVFSHLGDEDAFAGFVTDIDLAAPGLRAIDAHRANNAGDAGAIRISAFPARPTYAELVARFGPALSIKRACGFRELAYAASGDAQPVLFAIYGPGDALRALGVQRSS